MQGGLNRKNNVIFHESRKANLLIVNIVTDYYFTLDLVTTLKKKFYFLVLSLSFRFFQTQNTLRREKGISFIREDFSIEGRSIKEKGTFWGASL